MHGSSFSSKIACNLILYAATKGANPKILFRLLNLDEKDRNRDDVRIPCHLMAKVWEKSHELCEDLFLAFHMGVDFSYTARRTPSLIMQSCKTVAEAFQQGIHYSEIIANVFTMQFGEDRDNFYIDFIAKEDWRSVSANVLRDSISITIVSNLNSLQMCVGKFISPSILHFEFSRPQNIHEYLHIFNASIKFNQPHNRIGFPKDISHLPIATCDNGLLGSLKKYGDELKKNIFAKENFRERIQAIIINTIAPPKSPSIQNIAEEINMTVRTLQRKLKTEGTRFQTLLDQVRQQLAAKYLTESDKSLFEISYLLGYADTTSFIRAYKRWYGKTPRQRD